MVEIVGHGNMVFKGKTPVEDGKEFSREKADRYGVPRFARVEIPLVGRTQLRDYAKELRELANTLDTLSHDLVTDETFLVMRARAEIAHVSNRMRNRRKGGE